MLREILARFGVQVDSRRLQGFGQAITSARNALAGLAIVIVARRLIQGLASFITEMAQLGDEAAKTARQLGISGDQLLAWRFAAERAGVPAEALTNGLRRLQRNLVDAAEGSETARRAFRAIGVEVEDSEGNFREIEDILPEIADGFAGLETDTERSARAQQLFGRAGAQLLPFFEGGSEGLAEMQARFLELTGGGFGPFLESSEAAQDAMADFDLASFAVRATLATELLPILTGMVSTIAEMVGFFRRLTERTNILRNVFIALGIIAAPIFLSILIALSPVLIAMAAIALAIGIVVIAVDELLTFMEGGDTIIGRFLDEAFGEGTGAEVAKAIRLAWEGFVRFFQRNVLPLIIRLIRFLVREIPPAAAAAARFIGRVVRAIVAFVQNTISTVQGFITEAETFIMDFVSRVEAAINRVRGVVGRVAGFFGIETGVAGAPSSGAPAGAQGPTAGVVRRQGGAQVTQEQTNNITIENAGEGPTPEFQRRVRDAINEANNVMLRKTARALTQTALAEVAGT